MNTNISIEEKYNNLKDMLKKMGTVLVAYSGGVDSTFLLKVASDALKEKAYAGIGFSETYPEKEMKDAKKYAEQMGVEYVIVRTKELSDSNFSSNSTKRCYYCKSELFSKLKDVASEKNINQIVDGSNFEDTGDFRPGIQAACDMGVVSPLKECGFMKSEIRELSQQLGLETWDKPAKACLSSRFPYGTVITEEKLRMIDQAESFLEELGFSQQRVRYHDDIARIEIPGEELGNIISGPISQKVINKFKEIGFVYVTVDLQGFRSGSMNEVLKTRQV